MLSTTGKKIGRGSLILLIVLATLATLGTGITAFTGKNGVKLAIAAELYDPLLVVHIFLGTVAVLLGMFQFSSRIRTERPRIHRTLGRIYIGSVMTSGVIALFLALFTVSFNEQISFLTLDVLWLFSGWKAFRAIRRGNVTEHRTWIVRNYALTLAAIFARLVVPFLTLVLLLKGASPGSFAALLQESLGTGVWLTIVINLALADWLVNRRMNMRNPIENSRGARVKKQTERASQPQQAEQPAYTDSGRE